ncbi:MAG: TonB C-terminal domain-containing protein [Deltaproteobacteria bacterium]|nr:TonB C-terminal domain-containing protein [Deltaproteobacteria bacterium]MBI3296359.1 TonB C-terminal domain-containing protein [Deltaproteobacteria bacterium]
MGGSRNTPLLLALGLAALAHWYVARISVVGVALMESKKESDPIEVTTESDRPVVFSQKALERENENAEARFLGEFRNRVRTETRSPVSGQFLRGLAVARLDGYGESTLMQSGQTPNLLPNDIAPGLDTVLNTDHYRYASFINRIADTIYQPWVEQIEHARSALAATGKNVESNLYVTRLRVTLNHIGEVIGVQMVNICGVKSFDDAPKQAFWQVAEFPNPPQDLFAQSETIHLEYEFHLELRSSLFEIFPSTV